MVIPLADRRSELRANCLIKSAVGFHRVAKHQAETLGRSNRTNLARRKKAEATEFCRFRRQCQTRSFLKAECSIISKFSAAAGVARTGWRKPPPANQRLGTACSLPE